MKSDGEKKKREKNFPARNLFLRDDKTVLALAQARGGERESIEREEEKKTNEKVRTHRPHAHTRTTRSRAHTHTRTPSPVSKEMTEVANPFRAVARTSRVE